MPYINDYDRSYKPLAQDLRRNMTDEEKKLWYQFLKYIPFPVHRQKTIANYIVDFYISKKDLVIELDGIQHAFPENAVADEKRDADLKQKGCTVLRYPNSLIHKQFRSVCDDILLHLGITWEDVKPRPWRIKTKNSE